METTKKITVILSLCAMSIIIAGCNDSYAQKKETMVQEWEKSTVEAKLTIVKDMIDRGELERAKEELSKCLAADSGNPKTYLLIGQVHFIEGRNDKAREAFLKAVELDSELAEGWHQLGSLYVMEKNYEMALEYCKKAHELHPSNTEYITSVYEIYIEMDQLDQAQALIQESLSRQPNSLELMLANARLYERNGEYTKAVQIYEQALLIHNNDPAVLELCGYAYMALGQWAQAGEKFELLLDHYKDDQEHYNLILRSLAICSFNAENYGRALTCYDQLSLVYRNDADIWLSMAQSALGLGDAARAADCAKRALRFKPGWPKACAVLGGALYINRGYEQAIEIFAKIVSDDEYAAFAWFMTGRCYRQLGQTVQANSAFERAEQLDPDNELVTTFLKRTFRSL